MPQDNSDEGMQPSIGIYERATFIKEQRYPVRERRLHGECSKNHILFQHGEDNTNLAYLGDSSYLYKTMSFGNMRLTKARRKSLLKGMKFETLDYSQSRSVQVRTLDCVN